MEIPEEQRDAPIACCQTDADLEALDIRRKFTVADFAYNPDSVITGPPEEDSETPGSSMQTWRSKMEREARIARVA